MNYILSAVVALIVSVGAVFALTPEATNGPSVGGIASPDVYSYMNVKGAFSQGGGATATTTTIAAGTGIDLQEPDGQNVVVGPDNYAWLTCFREVSTNVVCRVDETIPAD